MSGKILDLNEVVDGQRLTGTSLALVNGLGIHDGFTFSAGALDYQVNFAQATRPLWLIPIGLVLLAVAAMRSM